jgi:hypothetical protein
MGEAGEQGVEMGLSKQNNSSYLYDFTFYGR